MVFTRTLINIIVLSSEYLKPTTLGCGLGRALSIEVDLE